ncbi:MAG: transposase [bacterium]|nr:transposase [bacterium]
MASEKFHGKYRIASTRMKEWDYRQNGCYFVTICTKNRDEYFGEIKSGEMQSNEHGKIARKLWLEIPNHFGNARIDEYVIMPNHLHGIIILDDKREDDKINVETLQCNVSVNAVENEFHSKISPRPKSLSTIIRSYKSICTRMINELETLQCNVSTKFGWQSGFYDHVIRNDASLDKIREYILNNPAQWADDEYNLAKRKQKKE